MLERISDALLQNFQSVPLEKFQYVPPENFQSVPPENFHLYSREFSICTSLPLLTFNFWEVSENARETEIALLDVM